METKEIIKDLVKKSANDAFNLLTNQSTDKRLIYPFYTGNSAKKNAKVNETRDSEQELKQLFIENLCKEDNSVQCFYSVETPTQFAYSFSDSKDKKNKEPEISQNKGKIDHRKYQSARIDLSLYNSNNATKPECHIEFKNGNPGEKDIKKDILKLIVEGQNTENYFIHINVLDGNDVDRDTQLSLRGKFTRSYIYAKSKTNTYYQQHNITVYIIYICRKNDKPIIEKKVFEPNKIYENEADGKTEWTKVKFD